MPSTKTLSNKLLEDPKTVILDLETTGFLKDDPEAKIVQLTLMNNLGKVLFSSLINPEREIPERATKVHKISNDDVKKAPTLLQVIPIIKNYLDRCALVVYNAAFDVHFLTHSLKQIGVEDKIKFGEIYCAMEMYQRWSGSQKWLSLPNLSGGKKHDSTVDCYNTLLLLQKMAGTFEEREQISLDF